MLLGLNRPVARLGFYLQPRHLASQTCGESAKKALIILAPGAEEMEFTISADVLRRAKVSSLEGQQLKACPVTWLNGSALQK